jgi:hypothetical protein
MTLEPRSHDRRRYANWFEVGFTPDEFVLDFGQAYDAETPQVHTGIITTPRLARGLLEMLGRSLEEHRMLFPGDLDESEGGDNDFR